MAIAIDLFNDHGRWIAGLFADIGEQARDAFHGVLRNVWRNVEMPTTLGTVAAERDVG